MRKHNPGRHPPVSHSIEVFTAAWLTEYQTIDHAPNPSRARVTPTIPDMTSAAELATAIIRTSIRFISRLICMIARPLMTKVRKITFDIGISSS